MKLVLYDRFWDALIKLPKTIQKKVPEFIQKFKEDPKSGAIHLEPISTFKDKNLRTARIDLKYRAIIHVPESGDVYHLLWIDNHDEAMDWAKDKIFSWNENTQSYQIFTAPESIEKVQHVLPVPEGKPVSAGFLDAHRDEDLEKIGVPAVLLPSVRKLNTLADLEALEKYLPVEAFENLFYLFDGADIHRIIEEVEEGKIVSDDFETQTRSANNQRSFFELTDDDLLNEVLSGELQKWKVYLHPSQRALVNGHFKGSMKVTGGAGTGKTVAALHRAKYLLENDLGRNGKRILFTTFTKSLTRNLEKELPGMRIDTSKIALINLDRFAVEEAQRLSLVNETVKILDFPGARKSQDIWDEVLDYELSAFGSRFLDAEWKNVILFNHVKTEQEYFNTPRTGQHTRISRKDKMQIWKLCQAYQQRKMELNYVDQHEVYNLLYDHYREVQEKPFGHIIADEIQDFSNVELRLLRVLVEEKPNDLFLVGDPLQRIYGRSLNFSKAGINVRGRRSRRLKINYRTTEEIKRAAVSTIQHIAFDDFDGEEESKKGYVSLRHGLAPTYPVFKEKGQELDFIMDKIYAYTDPLQEDAFHLKDICIAARTRNALKDITSRLHNEQVAYYDITTGSGKGDREKGVHLSTFHNMKGLEFKVVFLIDVNERTLPFHPADYANWDETAQKEHDQSELALIYVAMTRAVHVLHLTGIGSRSKVLKVGEL
ncbi:MAG: ATP-dependent helicase [Saprospiraceae bacterium]|nr:ATP-dependent helicase [Saprospiraceae bacterium]